jgi:hypothetical protein
LQERKEKIMDILVVIFALMGLVMIASLIVRGSMSFFSFITDTPPKLSPVDLSTKQSATGKCFIKNYGYYAPTKKYVADVVCPDLDYCMMEVSDSKAGLEKNITWRFERLEERIREERNKAFLERHEKKKVFLIKT